MRNCYTITALIATTLIGGCVSPDVVQTSTVNDNNLNCSEIQTQLTQLESIREEARKGQTLSGQNVAAAIIFWPAVVGNYSNAKQALEAAEKRNEVLVELANRKQCQF